jgi:hypothetical protein
MVKADVQIKHQAQTANDLSWLLFQILKEYPTNFLNGLRFRLG